MDQALQYLSKDMEAVEAAIVDSLQFDGELIGEVGRYLAESKGKRLRPMMTLLSARLQGRDGPGPFGPSVAAAMELVHLATLLHDDVIDKARTRRGRPSVNAKWGDDVAILMADNLFSCAFAAILEGGGARAAKILTHATCRMCEGEIFQIQKRDQLLTVEDYLKVIEAKTARLFSACAQIGAVMAGASDEAVAAMRDFGLEFGVAFQITDDLLDYTASGARWGKQVGTDIGNGKQTLPFILAITDADDKDREFLLASLSNGRRDLSGVLERITRYGGVDHSQAMAREYTERSLEALGPLPDTEARTHLERLAAYIANRKY